MTIQQLNEALFASKASVGNPEHCGCEDCAFYADNIIKNKELVSFLASKGIDPQKADEAWCYNEENGYKYFSVDFFELHSDMEGTFTFGMMKVILFHIPYAEEGELCYGMAIEGAMKIN